MKRNASKLDNDEARLSNLLFNKSKKIAEKLKNFEGVQPDIEEKPAWIDDDDEAFRVKDVEKTKSKAAYSEKLKQKYETLLGTPGWAKLNKKEEQEDDEIIRTVGHLQKKKSANLAKDFLAFKKCPRINKCTANEGPIITAVEFHPKMNVSLVAGSSGVVSLFSIGGEENEKLHSFKLKKYKVSTAHFSPNGTEAYISSRSSHNFCIYDLVKAEPNLFQLPRLVTRPSVFKLSNDGKYIAAAIGFEEVYIISTDSRELLRSLKNNSVVKSFTFSHDNKQLYCYSTQGEVTIWDMATYRVVKKFYDQGCVTASCIAASHCGRLLATGSGEGIVNVYETSSFQSGEPLPLKVLSNLRTKITGLEFNATSELLSMVSGFFPNAVKLVHIPSYHVYMNFPPPTDNLSQVETVRFSPNSGYMSMGNNKSCAYLFRLKYYKNY